MWELCNVQELDKEYVMYLKNTKSSIIADYPSLSGALNNLNHVCSNKQFILIFVESSQKGFVCYNSGIISENREILKLNLEQIIQSHNIEQRIYLNKINTLPN